MRLVELADAFHVAPDIEFVGTAPKPTVSPDSRVRVVRSEVDCLAPPVGSLQIQTGPATDAPRGLGGVVVADRTVEHLQHVEIPRVGATRIDRAGHLGNARNRSRSIGVPLVNESMGAAAHVTEFQCPVPTGFECPRKVVLVGVGSGEFRIQRVPNAPSGRIQVGRIQLSEGFQQVSRVDHHTEHARRVEPRLHVRGIEELPVMQSVSAAKDTEASTWTIGESQRGG